MGVKVVLPPEKPDGNMCSGCTVRCCTLRIDLTIYDIARLAMMTRTPVNEFLGYTDAAGDDRFGFRCLGKKVKFVLMKKEDGLCVFFDEKRGLYCTVEEAKPSACLAYPMALTEDGEIVIRRDALCPRENLRRADFNKMSREVIEEYVRERDMQAEFVSDWNRRADGGEPPEDFLKFAAAELDLERTPWGRLLRRLKKRFRGF